MIGCSPRDEIFIHIAQSREIMPAGGSMSSRRSPSTKIPFVRFVYFLDIVPKLFHSQRRKRFSPQRLGFLDRPIDEQTYRTEQIIREFRIFIQKSPLFKDKLSPDRNEPVINLNANFLRPVRSVPPLIHPIPQTKDKIVSARYAALPQFVDIFRDEHLKRIARLIKQQISLIHPSHCAVQKDLATAFRLNTEKISLQPSVKMKLLRMIRITAEQNLCPHGPDHCPSCSNVPTETGNSISTVVPTPTVL